MENEPVLRIGVRLEVMRSGTQQAHYAKIEDVSTWEFAISALFGGHETEILQSGEEVECIFTDPRTQNQYGFNSRVLRREVREVPMYFLAVPSEFERIQRRGFVRYPVLIAAQYRQGDDNRWNKGFLVDISGSGARLSHRHPIPNETIQLAFTLKAHDTPLIVTGRIVRSEPLNGNDHTTYHSGIEFVEIPMGVQDRIVGFVFQRMLEQRRSQEW